MIMIYSYNKGSTIVRMAQSVLGTTKFREGLQLYCQRHAYGNTETSDLWQAWSDVSGIDMFALMASWTRQLGYPYISIEEEQWAEGDTSVRLKLKQQWFLNDGMAAEGAERAICWSIPLLVSSSADVSQEAGRAKKGRGEAAGLMEASNIVTMTSFDRERFVLIPKIGRASESIRI